MVRQRLLLGAGLLLAGLAVVVVLGRAEASPVVRTLALGGYPIGIAVDGGTGRAFVIKNGDRTVSVVDTASGAILRVVSVQSAANRFAGGAWWVAVDVRTRHAFVGACCESNGAGTFGTVSMLDARSGAVLRTITLGMASQATNPGAIGVSERTGHVFITNYDSGTVSMLDSRSGALLRTITLHQNPAAIAVSERADHVFVVNNGMVSMLDSGSGTLLRTLVVGRNPWAIAVSERTRHVFVLNSTSVSMLDARSGALLHTAVVTMGMQLCSSICAGANPIGVDERTGRVFIADSDFDQGRLSMLDARTGAVLRTSAVDYFAATVAVDDRTGHVLVTDLGKPDIADNLTRNGNVFVLDGQSTAVLHTIPVGMAPYTIVPDGRTGRAYVVNSDINPDSSIVQVHASQSWWTAWQERLPQWLPLLHQAPAIAGGSVTMLDLSRM